MTTVAKTVLGVASVIALGMSAQAQLYTERDEETVRERPRPEYDPAGVYLRRFVARPDFQFGVRYSDNIFAREEDTQEDLIANVLLTGAVTSDFSRHAVEAYYTVDYDYYTDIGADTTGDGTEDETNTEYTFGLRSRLDLLRASSVSFDVSYSSRREDRAAAETVIFTGDVVGELLDRLDDIDGNVNLTTAPFDVLEEIAAREDGDGTVGGQGLDDEEVAVLEEIGAALFTDEPIEYEVVRGAVIGRHVFDQLRLIAGLDVSNTIYKNAFSSRLEAAQNLVSDTRVADGRDPLIRVRNAGVVDLSERDRLETRMNLRAEYQFTPGAYALAEVVYKDVDFTFNFDESSLVSVARDRSAAGYELLGGLGFDLTRLLRGEVGVRFVQEEFDRDEFIDPDTGARTPLFDSASGAGVSADLTWLMSPLTNFIFTANTEIRPTVLEGASSILASNAGVVVDHELARNIILFGEAQYFLEDYQELDREDSRYEYGVGLLYLLDNRYSIEMSAARTEQESTGGAGRSFDVNRISAALRVRL